MREPFFWILRHVSLATSFVFLGFLVYTEDSCERVMAWHKTLAAARERERERETEKNTVNRPRLPRRGRGCGVRRVASVRRSLAAAGGGADRAAHAQFGGGLGLGFGLVIVAAFGLSVPVAAAAVVWPRLAALTFSAL